MLLCIEILATHLLTLIISRNFNWVTKTSSSSSSKKKKKKKKLVPEPIVRMDTTIQTDVVHINPYVSSMLAVSLGLKLADAIRRICLYTKPQHADQTFYAACRGIFPIQELCGIVSALSLARRDVLGQPMPVWKLLLPSAILHGMANFRGMKVSVYLDCLCLCS